MALHYFGPGAAFSPMESAITCLSFDLPVAAYIVAVYRYGLLRTGQSRGHATELEVSPGVQDQAATR